MTVDSSQKSELGDFKLIPAEGKTLRYFIDHQSKLLIVSEFPIDTSNIPSQYGIRIIPNAQYIVDTKRKMILTPPEWKEYFNYDKLEVISADGKLKEIIQRVHEPENNTDLLKYSLIDLEGNKTIYANGTSVAFCEAPRESSIDRHYQDLENRKRYVKSLELGEYPQVDYNNNLANLKEGDIVIQYFNDKEVFELKVEQGRFSLKKASMPTSIKEWDNIISNTIYTFDNLDAFWNHLTFKPGKWNFFNDRRPWYSKYNLRIKSFAIEKFIIEEHNRIVQDRVVPYLEYQQINNWMNINFNQALERNVLWQFCSNCRARVYYNPRYPNHACGKCVDQIIDSKGNKLDYSDKHELKFVNGKERLTLKETNEEVKIFLNEVEYYASEARFGGIVHQLKE